MKKDKIIKSIFCLAALVSFISCASSPAETLESQIISVAETVMPSVVEINTVNREEEASVRSLNDYFGDKEEDLREENYSNGIGSGVILRKKGHRYYILTNNHVIEEQDKVYVTLYEGTVVEGRVLGVDMRFDVAVIEIITSVPLKTARPGDSSLLKQGQWVIALGSPLGYSESVSLGIVSNIGRFGGPKGIISDFIQTDAAINQGNSGGPLTNIRGEVVGLNTWISTPSGGSVGLGFALPINNITKSFDSIISDGVVKSGWLGVSSGGIPSHYRGLTTKGTFVYQVLLGSPAWHYGIRPGDIIIGINDRGIDSTEQLVLQTSFTNMGDSVEIHLLRQGKSLKLPVIVGQRVDENAEHSEALWPGFAVYEDKGIVHVLNVFPKSLAQKGGLLPDDIILSVNEEKVSGIKDFYLILSKSNIINVKVLRGDGEHIVTLSTGEGDNNG